MKKILILGANGMLGHKLMQRFAERADTFGTVRSCSIEDASHGVLDSARVLPGVTAEDMDRLVQAIRTIRPHVIVNCIGVIKRAIAAADPIAAIRVNALFPHRLGELCRAVGVRLIHISTDCVFSGRKGDYTESDPCDAEDLYGRSKSLGEVDAEGVLTVRTSVIGHELGTRRGLLEWFLSQAGETVLGYRRAVFSGFPSCVLADLLLRVILECPKLHGIWHVASRPINKFDLLQAVNETYASKVRVEPDDAFICDRSLNGERFRHATGIAAPPWPEMITRMYEDHFQQQRTQA